MHKWTCRLHFSLWKWTSSVGRQLLCSRSKSSSRRNWRSNAFRPIDWKSHLRMLLWRNSYFVAILYLCKAWWICVVQIFVQLIRFCGSRLFFGAVHPKEVLLTVTLTIKCVISFHQIFKFLMEFLDNNNTQCTVAHYLSSDALVLGRNVSRSDPSYYMHYCSLQVETACKLMLRAHNRS